MIIQQFDPTEFLREYWQKKPCVIKQFISDFNDPIDEDDLAGLAQENDVDCRIVSRTQSAQKQPANWQVAQGPFDSFDEHCQGDWSLLVQGVDRYIQDIDQLAKCINFIPNWRFDDVMVSFSVANAGVGAHTDQYDVFIIQGKGSRRWQVGLPINDDIETLLPHPLLKQIAGFDAIIDEVLSPGDAVYIPPKHPHNGVALENCINYSIGFRAPTNLEMLTGLLDETDNLINVQSRYTDPNIQALRGSDLALSEVSDNELRQAKQSIIELLNSELAEQALLQYLSRQSLPDLCEDESYLIADAHELIDAENTIAKLPGVRPIYHRTNNQIFTFYIDGNLFEVPAGISDAVQALLNADEFQLSQSQFSQFGIKDKNLTAMATLITQLLNAGYWEALSD